MAATKKVVELPEPKVTDAESLEKQLKADGYQANVWYDGEAGLTYAKVTKDDYSRLIGLQPQEFQLNNFYGDFVARLGI